jgi:hypothetical protein
MRIENKRMMVFLKFHGIRAKARYEREGSMRGTWSLYDQETAWEPTLTAKLTELGFTDFQGKPLSWYSGNGGRFSVSVRGHNELLLGDPVFGPSSGSLPALKGSAGLVNVPHGHQAPRPETDETLEAKAGVITAAREIWADICLRNLASYGDEGSCVMGAAISCSYLAPGCWKPVDRELSPAGDVARAQGSLNWERGNGKVLEYLQANGIPSAYYNCGRMD